MDNYTAVEIEHEYLKVFKAVGGTDVWAEDNGRDHGLYCSQCKRSQPMTVLFIDCFFFSIPKDPKCTNCGEHYISFAMGNGWSRSIDRDHKCVSRCTSSKHYRYNS